MSWKTVSILLVFFLVFSSFFPENAFAESITPQVDPSVVGPSPIKPNDYVIGKRQTFRFTQYSGVTKYKIEVSNVDTSEVVYTYKGTATCDTGLGECWMQPDISLKPMDMSGLTGHYYWKVKAKVGGFWQKDYSEPMGFLVVSPGFNSTFTTDAKKWVFTSGTWTLLSAGYLKGSLANPGYATIYHKELFYPWLKDIVYEVRMKRKVEWDAENRLYFCGQPLPDGGQGWYSGYSFQYISGLWSFFRWDYGVPTLISEGWPESDAIVDGWNTLTVWKHNNNYIDLFINGTWVGQYYDSHYHEGAVGVGLQELYPGSSPLLVDYVKVYYTDTEPFSIP